MIPTQTKQNNMPKACQYIIQDREAGNFIDEFETMEDARKELKAYEESDKEEGIYAPDFYEIIKKEAQK